MPIDDDNVEYDAHEGEWKEFHTKADRDAGKWVSGECIDCDNKTPDANGWITGYQNLDSFDRDYEDEP